MAAPKPQELVQTQANIARPEAPPQRQADPEVLRELARLAERVGGLEKLKESLTCSSPFRPE